MKRPPNAGSFKKGQSGNPSGRPKATEAQRAARELRASLQPDMVKVLAGIALDDGADTRDRIAAARALLEESPKEIMATVNRGDAPTPQLGEVLAALATTLKKDDGDE